MHSRSKGDLQSAETYEHLGAQAPASVAQKNPNAETQAGTIYIRVEVIEADLSRNLQDSVPIPEVLQKRPCVTREIDVNEAGKYFTMAILNCLEPSRHVWYWVTGAFASPGFERLDAINVTR